MRWILVVAVLLGATKLWAAEGHEKYHKDFYDQLKMPSGISCCNEKDCGPVKDWRYNREIEQYQVFYQGSWKTPPQDRIQHKVTPDGGAHVCARPAWYPGRGGGGTYGGLIWFCVIIPQGLF